MGDSDDDYDRKRRDKFKGERTESYGRDGRRGDDRRGRGGDEWERDWPNGRSGNKRDYREFRGGGVRDHYSPHRNQDVMPPAKKFRGDWDDKMRYGGFDFYGPMKGGGSWGHGDPYYGGGFGNNFGGGHMGAGASNKSEPTGGNMYVETQPPMMTFKAFLATQEDSITDEEAIKRYNTYKLEFKKQQLNDFFVAHKDEEWFKTKYHPEESSKRKEEQLDAIKKRIKVFQSLLDSGETEQVTLDIDRTDEILTLLDAVVIQLEGGTAEDLRLFRLSEGSQIVKMEKPEVIIPDVKIKVEKDNYKEKEKEKEREEEEKEKEVEKSEKTSIETTPAEETPSKEIQAEEMPPEETPTEETLSDEMPAEPAVETSTEEKKDEESEKEESNESKMDDSIEEEKKDEDKKMEEDEKDEEEEEEVKEIKPKVPSPESVKAIHESINRRFLHKTSSIFLRNLAPTVTKAEVEAVCKKFPGFLRVAIADPQPERRWFRRGWVSFERNVNIKEICWNLNNIRLRDCELGAIVNRDLSKRIRSVGGITCHKQIVKNDIKLSAKITYNLDNRLGLWKKDNSTAEEQQQQQKELLPFLSENPVLKNITDYLIEEASAEEEELLGIPGNQEDGQSGESEDSIERDPTLVKVLDKILYYLRIVHSVDYYNHCEYPNEDEMPNRCGIMHVRGAPSPGSKVSKAEVEEYCRNFESKISSFLTLHNPEEEAEYQKLGAKNSDLEVEKFVQANTQEIAKDKWLCPLSGKKFKGPDFIRKHIFNKHAEKVDEVRSEAEYFNNYLKDSKRPQLPDHPGNRAPPKDTNKEQNPIVKMPPQVTPFIFMGGRPGAMPYGMSLGPAFGMPPRQPRGFGRGRGSSDFRPVIHYRDLDAPREPDEFL